MASPNPVPPYNLAVSLDACWKFSNILASFSSVMPIPVSAITGDALTFKKSLYIIDI